MLSAQSFLVRGLLAGLIAGIVAFGVAYVVGEPTVNAGIALEESAGHSHQHGTSEESQSGHAAEPETVVPRSLQSTAGLLTGTVVAGVTLGGLVGLFSALALGRLGALGSRATTLTVTAVGFAALYVVPFVAYPPNPPGVGRGETIGGRTAAYFILVAISVLAVAVAVLVGRWLAARQGGWLGAIAAVGCYLLLTVTAMALLPSFQEVPDDYPAVVLYEFRRASLLTALTLWAVLGAVLADAVGRLTARAQIPDTATSAVTEPVR